MICAQTRAPGVSVSQVARRYDVNANQVFNWLKDPRFAVAADADEEEARFLPVEIVSAPEPSPAPDPASAPGTASGELVIALACGHRLTVTGRFDPDALAALVRRLSP